MDYVVVSYTETDYTPDTGTYLIPLSVIEKIKSVNGLKDFRAVSGKMVNERDTSEEETNTILKIDQMLRSYDDEFLEDIHPEELVEESERGLLECYKMKPGITVQGISIVDIISTGFLS